MKAHGRIFPSILSSFLLSLEIDAFQSNYVRASSKNSAFVKSSHPLSLVSSDANLSSLSNSRSSLVMYDDSSSKPSSDTSKTDIVWTTLSNTEKWIQKTLGVSSGSMSSSNPYTRKEVAYVCETSYLLEEVVAGVFRRLREMREMGVGHGQAEQELSKTQGAGYRPHTFRQTLVVVSPSCEVLNTSFDVFDNLILSINEARRNARDYVTDSSFENINSDWSQDWITSVSLAHLHPEFGNYVKDGSSPATGSNVVGTSKTEAIKEGIDPATQQYMKQKMMARRSPYPSIVIEVKSTPPFMSNEITKTDRKRSGVGGSSKASDTRPDPNDSVSSEDVKKLETLFGMKAAFNTGDDAKPTEKIKNKSEEDDMWDALSRSKNIKQITFLTPVDNAQKWVIENDRLYDAHSSYFTSFETTHVDAAYEFIFATIAMQRNRASSKVGTDDDIMLKRDYLIFPNFLSKAATSFEKFSGQVQKIINSIPGISEVLCVSTFHPEHVDETKRSPVPILVLEAVHML